jgi:hypothetical protein
MTCLHKRDTSRWVDEYEDHWGIVEGHWEYSEENTYVDIDLHRYKCVQCNEVFYYSGRARQHFEEGVKFDWITGLDK